MFRRSRTETDPAAEQATDPAAQPGGKGRPTPSRREAQQAARERARQGMDKKAAAKLLRERRATQAAKAREGMKAGDERYLMARDKGPVRRFVRDYVDARITFVELALPLLVLSIVLQAVGAQQMSAALSYVIWLVALFDIAWIFWRLGRELRQRFPDQEVKGWRLYAVSRAIQIRPLRIPKPQVKLYQPLPEHYR